MNNSLHIYYNKQIFISVVISIFYTKVFTLALANVLRAGGQESEDGCEVQYWLTVFNRPSHKIMRMLACGVRAHK